jgi:hypothetical protein
VPIDPPHRRGRRDNGLDAVAFVPLADVDPRIGEHLLDVLRVAGVPAYLEPSVDIEPYTRTLAIPSPPTDRLWVDREQRAEARRIVEAEAAQAGVDQPGPARRPADRPSAGLDAEEELIWRQIVAGYSDEAEPPAVPRWPVSEDADPAAPDGAEGADGGRRPGAATDQADPPDQPAGLLDGLDRLAAEPPVEDEGHYEPPPPPPLPRLSKQAVLGLVLLGLGAGILGGGALIGLDGADRLLFGVVALLAGAAVLVNRLRDSRADDGPDDGAVV